MNIRDFYETVILRDVLEYLSPGLIFLASLGGLADLFILGLKNETIFWPTVISVITHYPWWAVGIILFSGYITGHFLTAAAKLVGKFDNSREDEHEQKIFELFFQNNSAFPYDQLNSTLQPKEFREIVRGIVEVRQPSLFRVYVLRHSIFSRFSQNIVITGGFCTVLGLSSATSLAIWYPAKEQWYLIIISVISCLVSILFWHRFKYLRNIMRKHTFQLLLIDSLASLGLKSTDAK